MSGINLILKYVNLNPQYYLKDHSSVLFNININIYSPDPNCRGGGYNKEGVGDTTQLCSLGGGGVIIN